MDEKLKRYRTAYSPFYNAFVEIVKVWEDSDGKPLIKARVGHSDLHIIFRETELTSYVF